MTTPTPRPALVLGAAALALLAACTGTTSPAPAPAASTSAADTATPTATSSTPGPEGPSSTPSATPTTASPSATATADVAALATAPVPARCDGPATRLVDHVVQTGEGSPYEGALMHGQRINPGNRTTPSTVVADLDGDGTPELASGYWCDNLDGPYADAVLVHDATGRRLVAWLDLSAVAPTARLRTLAADGRTLRMVVTVGERATNHTATLSGGRLLLDGRATSPSSASPSPSRAPGRTPTTSPVGITVTGPGDAARLTDEGLRRLALQRIEALSQYASATGTSITVLSYDPAGRATVKVTSVEGWRETWARGADGTWKVTGRAG